MNKIFLTILTIFLVFMCKSQVKKTIDTTQMSIPYTVVQKILLDLNDYEKLKELSKLDEKEIVELNNKINILEKTNTFWEYKDSLNLKIISQTEEKVLIHKNENESLKKENKNLKIRNGLYNIISGVIILPLTYLAIFKQ